MRWSWEGQWTGEQLGPILTWALKLLSLRKFVELLAPSQKDSHRFAFFILFPCTTFHFSTWRFELPSFNRTQHVLINSFGFSFLRLPLLAAFFCLCKHKLHEVHAIYSPPTHLYLGAGLCVPPQIGGLGFY